MCFFSSLALRLTEGGFSLGGGALLAVRLVNVVHWAHPLQAAEGTSIGGG